MRLLRERGANEKNEKGVGSKEEREVTVKK